MDRKPQRQETSALCSGALGSCLCCAQKSEVLREALFYTRTLKRASVGKKRDTEAGYETGPVSG